MNKKGKIKAPLLNIGGKVGLPTTIEVPKFEHPVFCFKHLHKDHCLEQCETADKLAFIERVVKLSSLTWDTIRISQRHGFGYEKIKRTSIKPSVPNSITEDVDDFLAFRFSGKKPMLGFKTQFIFHIVYIDSKFSVYDH